MLRAIIACAARTIPGALSANQKSFEPPTRQAIVSIGEKSPLHSLTLLLRRFLFGCRNDEAHTGGAPYTPKQSRAACAAPLQSQKQRARAPAPHNTCTSLRSICRSGA